MGRGKLPGTPNYQVDLLLDIIQEILPLDLVGWNKVATLYHRQSEESKRRRGDAICHYFARYLLQKKSNERCISIFHRMKKQFVFDSRNENCSDDDSFHLGNNDNSTLRYKFGDENDDDDDVVVEEDEEEEEKDEDDNEEEEQDEDDKAGFNEEESLHDTTVIQQQLPYTVKTPHDASMSTSMEHVLAMFALNNQTLERALRDMEQRWQQKYMKQEEQLHDVRERLKRFEQQQDGKAKEVKKRPRSTIDAVVKATEMKKRTMVSMTRYNEITPSKRKSSWV